MPYLKADAPLNTPEAETLESLLGKKNYHNTRLKRIKTIQDLTDAERNRSGLVTIGKRCITIPGDPFGVYPSWAGNVAHPEDERMVCCRDLQIYIRMLLTIGIVARYPASDLRDVDPVRDYPI